MKRNTLIEFVLEFAKSNKMLTLFIPIKAVIEVLINLTTILFSSEFLKLLLYQKSFDYLLFYALKMLLIILLFQVLLQILCRYIDAKKNCLLETQNYALNKESMEMDYTNLENIDIQKMRIRQDEFTNMTGGVYKVFMTTFEKGIKSIITVLGAISIMFINNTNHSWLESNGYIVMLIVLTAIGVFFQGKFLAKFNIATENYMEKCMEGNRLLIYYLYNVLFEYQTAKDLRIYNQQPLVLKGISEANDTFRLAGKEYARENRKKRYVSQTVSIIPGGLVYFFAGLSAYGGMIEIGDIVKIAGGISTLFRGFSDFSELYSEIYVLSEYVKEYMGYLDVNKRKNSLPSKGIECAQYVFSFENVSFRYPQTDEYVFQNLNLTLSEGEKIAIVGKNGSGKSTIIKLLCRLYDISDGVIKLNGIDIKEYDEAEYKSIFSAVFQDFSLFSFTVGENISASEKYDEERIRNVLQKSGLIGYIDEIEHRLNTVIGKEFDDNGIELSGGERQKIAIARAIYKSSPVVIMDEPTSALDPLSEYDVYSRFDNIIEYKIAIYISHRLASCRFCDRIIVFDKGKIVQEGKHEELLGQKGIYKEMWEAQAQHYKL